MIHARDLSDWLPEHIAEPLVKHLNAHKVHLHLANARKTVHGTFRSAYGNRPHRITVSATLNKYAFFVTLTHEIAHLLTFTAFGPKVDGHGAEWKRTFSQLMIPFLPDPWLPKDIALALKQHLHSVKYSSCADPILERALHAHDSLPDGHARLDSLAEGTVFVVKGKHYRKGPALRTRFRCPSVKGDSWLAAPGGYVVELAVA